MSTRSKAAAVLASTGVLVIGWQLGTANGQTVASAPVAGTATTPTTTTTTPSQTSSGSSTGSSGSTSPSSSTGSTSSAAGAYKDGTYTGQTASEHYGTVTVTVTISGGKVTDATAQTTIREQRSQHFIDRAVPVLREAIIAANSAKVNTVSGSTFTSEAYLTSLQSALDQATA